MNKKAMKRNRTLSICLLATMLLSLMSPFAVAAAMTEDGEYICGKIEHVHDGPCIQDLGWHYLCVDEDVDDLNHVHDESCYDSDGYLICLPAVRAAGEELYHEHNELCYNERGELVCPLQERIPHVHDDSCYATTIAQDPSTGTTEDDSQQTDSKVTGTPDDTLTSDNGGGEEEAATTDTAMPDDAAPEGESQESAGGQVAQSADSAEFSEDETAMAPVEVDPYLVCGLEEAHGGVRHIHTEACLAPKHGLVLTCGLEEHVHTDECKPAVQEPELVIKPGDMNGTTATATAADGGVAFTAAVHNDVVTETGNVQEFYFIISPAEPYPSVIMPDDNTAVIEGTGDATFKEIRFTEPGTYSFEITEEEGLDHYRYDDRTWEVTVTVTGAAGAPAGAVGGRYDTSAYDVPADADKDGWITEAEVQAVLAQLRIDYPDGSPWGSGDQWWSPVLGDGSECAGFAYMVSDKIFGNLPKYEVTMEETRVGDVLDNGPAYHTNVVLNDYGKDMYEGGNYTDSYTTADGNVSGTVGWDTVNYYDEWPAGTRDAVIYSRYPAGTNTPSTLEIDSVTYKCGETTSTEGASFGNGSVYFVNAEHTSIPVLIMLDGNPYEISTIAALYQDADVETGKYISLNDFARALSTYGFSLADYDGSFILGLQLSDGEPITVYEYEPSKSGETWRIPVPADVDFSQAKAYFLPNGPIVGEYTAETVTQKHGYWSVKVVDTYGVTQEDETDVSTSMYVPSGRSVTLTLPTRGYPWIWKVLAGNTGNPGTEEDSNISADISKGAEYTSIRLNDIHSPIIVTCDTAEQFDVRVTWGASVPLVAPTEKDGISIWDVSGKDIRYIDIAVNINNSSGKNAKITLPKALNVGPMEAVFKTEGISEKNGWTVETNSDETVTITSTASNGNNRSSIDVYYTVDCWNVESGKRFDIPYSAQIVNGSATTEGEKLSGTIITGHNMEFVEYLNDYGNSDYAFDGFGGADKKTAYIEHWDPAYETYFGLAKEEFDSEAYLYDIAAFEVQPTGQQPYDINGVISLGQGGELVGAIYMMDSAKRPDELWVKIASFASNEADSSNQYSFGVQNSQLNGKVVSNLSDGSDNKTYTLYFLVKYSKADIPSNLTLTAKLLLTHTGIYSGTAKTGEKNVCLYEGQKDINTRIYWASYVTDKVASRTGLSALRDNKPATIGFSADFFCLNEARFDRNEDDTYRLEAVIDLSYLTPSPTGYNTPAEDYLHEGDYRFSSFNIGLIDAAGNWSQNTHGVPNVGWKNEVFGNAPEWANDKMIHVYGSTSLTGNNWTPLGAVSAASAWAIDRDRGLNNANIQKISGNYVRLKVVYDSRLTTALRVAYQLELQPAILNNHSIKDDNLYLTSWFNYLGYTADSQRDPKMEFNRYPVSDGGGWDKNTVGTLELARQHDERYPYPEYDAPENWYSQTEYSLRNYAKATLGNSKESAGMIVTQALYDSSGKLVGDPTSIDPVKKDSYSLKTDVTNVSEIVYSVSGAITNGASSLQDLQEHISTAENNSPYRSVKMRYFVLLPEGLKLNTTPDNGEYIENSTPKYHYWTEGTTKFLSANSAFYNNNSSKVVQGGATDIPVSDGNVTGWKRLSSNGWLSEMYWEAAGKVTLEDNNDQLYVFERTLDGYAWDQFNMWGDSTFFWGRGLSFSVVPKDGTGTLPADSYKVQFWCQYLDANGNPMSLGDFLKTEDVQKDSLASAGGGSQDSNSLLYIPISFKNSSGHGSSQAEIGTKNAEEHDYRKETVVNPEQMYSYKLDYAITDGSTENVVLWCNVEDYNRGNRSSQWKGTVTGVDVGDTGAKVYVRMDTFDVNAYLADAEKSWLTDDGMWIEANGQTDWSKVKAIAFSFEGEVFQAGQLVSVYIQMKAPSNESLMNASLVPTVSGPEYKTYNEYIFSDEHIGQGGTTTSGRVLVGHTTVTLIVNSFPERPMLPATGGPGFLFWYSIACAVVLFASGFGYIHLRKARNLYSEI